MKFCNNCSAPLDDDAVFCPECGESLANDFLFEKNDLNKNADAQNSEGFEHTIPTQNAQTDDYSYTAGSHKSYQNYPNKEMSEGNPGVLWVVLSSVSFFCCSFITSIPGFVMAVLATTSYNEGDYVKAKSRAKTAMILTISGIVLGFILRYIVIFGGYMSWVNQFMY